MPHGLLHASTADLQNGMVLTFSVWGTEDTDMGWLDVRMRGCSTISMLDDACFSRVIGAAM